MPKGCGLFLRRVLSFRAEVQKDTRPRAALIRGFQMKWWAGQSFLPWQPCRLDQSCNYWLTHPLGLGLGIKLEWSQSLWLEQKWNWIEVAKGRSGLQNIVCLENFSMQIGKSQVIALLKPQDLGENQAWEKQRLEFKLFPQSLKGTAKGKSC